jgi:hypothetical protein
MPQIAWFNATLSANGNNPPSPSRILESWPKPTLGVSTIATPEQKKEFLSVYPTEYVHYFFLLVLIITYLSRVYISLLGMC